MSTAGLPIVVAGEALIDLVQESGGNLRAHLGGGPFNTARTLARLERPTCFLGRLSTDRFGAGLREALAQDGVRLDAVVETEEPTTLALAELDAAGAARYRFYVDGTSAAGLTVADARQAMPRPSAFYMGALALVIEPMASTLEQVVEDLPSDTLLAIDPNCRPTAIRDVPAWRRRLSRLLARCDLLKVSEEDLAWLDPGATPLDAVRRLLAEGPSLGIVTRGADGALAVTTHDAVEVVGQPVEVVDTIGAGDAFGGGFLARWSELGMGRAGLGELDRVAEATAYACRVAALTCARAGAVPPRRAELSAP